MTFDCVQCLLENKDDCGQVHNIGGICEDCITAWDVEETEHLTMLARDPILGPLMEMEHPLVNPSKRISN